VTATGDKTLAARRDLLLQAYAAYNNQDVDVLLQLVSDDVDWPDDSAGRLHGKRSGTRLGICLFLFRRRRYKILSPNFVSGETVRGGLHPAHAHRLGRRAIIGG
jgi:hypothetical protein